MAEIRILAQILNMSLTGSLIILFVMLCRLMLKRAPKIYSYLLWSVVLLRLLCPVSLSVPFSFPEIMQSPAAVLSVGQSEEMEREHGDMISGQGRGESYLSAGIKTEMEQETNLSGQNLQDAVSEENKGLFTAAFFQSTVLGKSVMHGAYAAFWKTAFYMWTAGALLMLACGFISYGKLRRKLTGALHLRQNACHGILCRFGRDDRGACHPGKQAFELFSRHRARPLGG